MLLLPLLRSSSVPLPFPTPGPDPGLHFQLLLLDNVLVLEDPSGLPVPVLEGDGGGGKVGVFDCVDGAEFVRLWDDNEGVCAISSPR